VGSASQPPRDTGCSVTWDADHQPAYTGRSPEYPMIVGIGEVLWDVYPDGRKVAGGAPFNFAFHCHNLGHPAAIVSRVGDDDLGRELREHVRALGLSDEFIQTDPDHPTGTVEVALDANKVPTYTEDVAWDHLAWTDQVAALSAAAGVVCYGTLGVRCQPTFDVVNAFGTGADTLRVFDVNLRQDYFSRDAIAWGVARARWVKVSDEELPRVAALFDISAEPDALFAKVHQSLLRPDQLLIVTKGADGAELVWPEHDEMICEPGVPAAVADTVGAGDSFTAALVCKTREGWPLRRAAAFAVRYAARVCEFQGGTPALDPDDIDPDGP
jgi:fructokinase